ncbi:hypothetical protein D3C72_2248070 [compost metagenome]
MLFALGRGLLSPDAGALVADVRQGRGLEPKKSVHFPPQRRGRRQFFRPASIEAQREPMLRYRRMVAMIGGPAGQDGRAHPGQDFLLLLDR